MNAVFGVDLGTTFTSIATVGDNSLGRVEVLKIGDQGEAIESVVYLRDNDGHMEAWVGEEARDAALQFEGEGAFVELAKRSIGVAGAERRGWPVSVGPLYLWPQHVSSLVLRKVRQEVSSVRETAVRDVVITHPHHFGDAQKQATREAGELASLRVIDTLNEPTAAAIAYGIVGRGEPGLYMVFDLGGGTFDVTIVELSHNSISVVGGDGDSQLGGFDWERALMDHFNNEFRKAHPDFDLYSRATDQTRHFWRLAATKIKHQLSTSRVARAPLSAECDDEYFKCPVEVTRETFEALTAHLVERCRARCEALLSRLNFQWQNLKDVLMVGGSTRLPMIREMVARESGRPPRIEGFDPVTIVAQGAAIYAADASIRKAAERAAASEPSNSEQAGKSSGLAAR